MNVGQSCTQRRSIEVRRCQSRSCGVIKYTRQYPAAMNISMSSSDKPSALRAGEKLHPDVIALARSNTVGCRGANSARWPFTEGITSSEPSLRLKMIKYLEGERTCPTS